MAPIALRLAAVAGARRSELAGLRWAAVDGAEIVFDRQIVVDREHPDAEPGAPVIREDATKTGARRRVTVDAETAELLAEARVGREELAPWLFSDTDGPPNPDRVSWWWKRAREESGIDESWRLHDLRHWSATQAIAAGYDVQTVARRLGRADATTTLRVRLRRLCPASLTTGVRVSGDRVAIVDRAATLTVRSLYGTLVRSEEASWQRERNGSRLESLPKITAV